MSYVSDPQVQEAMAWAWAVGGLRQKEIALRSGTNYSQVCVAIMRFTTRCQPKLQELHLYGSDRRALLQRVFAGRPAPPYPEALRKRRVRVKAISRQWEAAPGTGSPTQSTTTE